MEQLEICMCYGDNDYDIVVDVTYFINTSGNYSSQAETPSEYYGESELEYDIISISTTGEDGTIYQHPTKDLADEFSEELYQKIWNKMVDSMEEVD